MDMGGDDEGGDDAEEEAYDVASDLAVDAEPAFEGTKTQAEQMREYVEKVSDPSNTEGADNKKSVVAGKNDMGGTTANIAKGEDAKESAKADSAKEDNAGNVNVPGGKASKSMTANGKGHGAEKKGAGESGTDKKSIVGS
jgi:hypothetical protein